MYTFSREIVGLFFF